MYSIQNDSGNYGIRIRSLIQEVSNNWKFALDSAGTIQTKYLPRDFTLCTSAIKIFQNTNGDSAKCVIGKVKLSRIFFNPAKEKGVLYIEFACGGLCGYGDFLIIEKVNGRWDITKATGYGFHEAIKRSRRIDTNNDLSNLLMLCPTCHSKITKKDISLEQVVARKQELQKKEVI